MTMTHGKQWTMLWQDGDDTWTMLWQTMATIAVFSVFNVFISQCIEQPVVSVDEPVRGRGERSPVSPKSQRPTTT